MSMERDGGAGDDELAPVIPLFGRGHGGRDASVSRVEGRGDTSNERGAEHRPPMRRFPVRHVPADARDPEPDGPDERAPTRSEPPERDPAARSESWHTTWRELGSRETAVRPAPKLSTVERGGVRFVELSKEDVVAEDDPSGVEDEIVERAEKKLMRSLGSRGLSVSEARAKLRQQDVPNEAIDGIIDRLERAGALDDERLAEQVVHSSSTRRNQGRRAIAQSLSARGIARDVVDRVIAELPDDDAERAYEFARSKARQLVRYDEDTALRRLVGQLSRRGFGGGLAMAAAKQALSEARTSPSRVRFE